MDSLYDVRTANSGDPVQGSQDASQLIDFITGCRMVTLSSTLWAEGHWPDLCSRVGTGHTDPLIGLLDAASAICKISFVDTFELKFTLDCFHGSLHGRSTGPEDIIHMPSHEALYGAITSPHDVCSRLKGDGKQSMFPHGVVQLTVGRIPSSVHGLLGDHQGSFLDSFHAILWQGKVQGSSEQFSLKKGGSNVATKDRPIIVSCN